MCTIIGQKNILSKIDSIDSLNMLPKANIILGKYGMGKHTILQYICNKYNVKSKYIDFELSTDILNDMYMLSEPRFYIIDIELLRKNKRIDRFQNTLLKFTEEPPVLAWVFIICNNTLDILKTLENRCQIWKLEPYSTTELQEIANIHNKQYSDFELSLLETPYDIIYRDSTQIQTILTLCDNIINNIYKATISNTLSIRNKLNMESDIDLFIQLLSNSLYLKYIDSNVAEQDRNKYLHAYILTLKLMSNLTILNINKNNLMDNFLLELKDIFTYDI